MTLRHIIGISFIFIYLLTFCEGHQILRVPYLVKHFQNHKTADPTMSVGEFVRIHYIYPIVQDDDFMQDQQLPFRNLDFNLHSMTQYTAQQESFEISLPAALVNEFHSYNEINKPRLKAFDIFQPPRNA